MMHELDPNDIWEAYLEEKPDPVSPQGAMAFAVEYILERYKLTPRHREAK